jgi:transposase
MPKRLELSPHATTQQLEHRYRKAKDPVERSHFQIVWLLSEGKGTQEVCEVTGYSVGWVRKIARRYNERGVDGLGDGRHSNPGAKRPERRSCWKPCRGRRRLFWAEGCGAGRRWRVG